MKRCNDCVTTECACIINFEARKGLASASLRTMAPWNLKPIAYKTRHNIRRFKMTTILLREGYQPTPQDIQNVASGSYLIDNKARNRRGYQWRTKLLAIRGILPKRVERTLRNSIRKYEHHDLTKKSEIAITDGWNFPPLQEDLNTKVLREAVFAPVQFPAPDAIMMSSASKKKLVDAGTNIYAHLMDQCAEFSVEGEGDDEENVVRTLGRSNLKSLSKSMAVKELPNASTAERELLAQVVSNSAIDSLEFIDRGPKLVKARAMAKITEGLVAPPVAQAPRMLTVVTESGCQSGDKIEFGCGTDDVEVPRVSFIAQKREHFRFYRGSNIVMADEKLTYHLKCKYFMKKRDSGAMHQMVSDARIYMLKNKHTMDNEADYDKMTRAVMAAFMVDANELEFRQRLKNETVYDGLVHVSATASGDLGKIDFSGARAGQGSWMHGFVRDYLPSLNLDKPKV